MIRILTWLWEQPGGRSTYNAEHVNIWAAMVSRHLTMPHEIACVTDMPDGIDSSVKIITPPGEFEEIRIPTWKEKSGLPQCFRRLSMFRPDAAGIFGDRFVSMDLDCVIAGALDPLFDHGDDFRMYRGTTSRRPYNGSMLQMTAGARPQVYTTFTARGAIEAGCKFVGSDQAWISHVLGWGEKTWGREHGVVWHGSQYNAEAPKPWRLMFFPGRTKPWQVEQSDVDGAWINFHYAADLKEAA